MDPARDNDNENDDGPLRAVDFPATDALLREDVKQLGALVGAILAEQRGPDFLDEVERLRRAAIARRESGAPVSDLADALAGTGLARAGDLVRAFATYFQAVNLAERVHRIRRRRDHERAGDGAQPGGLRDELGRLAAEGVGADELAALLSRLRIEPVFTAHPTEAVRRVLLHKEREIVAALVQDIDRGLTPAEREGAHERIRQALTTSWQTAEAPAARPSVADEFEHVGFYLSEVLYRVLPAFHEAFEQALHAHFAAGVAETGALDEVLGFGSWVGGDMDGNPNVGADTIAETVSGQRVLVLDAYRRDLDALAELLSQSTSRVAVSAEVTARIHEYVGLLPEAAAQLHPRHADMPYRNLAMLVAARLQATRNDAPGGYPDAAGFEADLARIAESLQAHRGEHAGLFAVRRLQRRARCFGFHLASLDLRQDSAVHEAALSALLDDADWESRPAGERAVRLHALLEGDAGPDGADDTDDEVARNTLEVFRTVARLRPRYGERVFGPYIVSMTRRPRMCLRCWRLRMSPVCVDGGSVPLDVAPLLETVDDLAAGREILGALFADPAYRAHLDSRGATPVRDARLLGFGQGRRHSSPRAGRCSAPRWSSPSWRVQPGCASFSSTAAAVRSSRGGGKTERAVIAAPRGSVDGYLRVTEQGEVIHRKYGIRSLALRNLEQTTGAVLRATLRPRPARAARSGVARDHGEHRRRAAKPIAAWCIRIRSFYAYFRDATPIDVIERMRIGSRPPSRKGQSSGSDLRAIPWVFAWSQNRAGLTAWYGAGSGLQAGIDAHGREAVAEMARDWPFFATLLEDIEMVLAKSDLAIFERYSKLAVDLPEGDLHARMHPDIAAEFARTRDAVLAIKDEAELLAHDRRLALSIRLRNPYVDPISLLQGRPALPLARRRARR
jgi:phosphoenolpyruvate carboxylase